MPILRQSIAFRLEASERCYGFYGRLYDLTRICDGTQRQLNRINYHGRHEFLAKDLVDCFDDPEFDTACASLFSPAYFPLHPGFQNRMLLEQNMN